MKCSTPAFFRHALLGGLASAALIFSAIPGCSGGGTSGTGGDISAVQRVDVRGTVFDAAGQPLPGVTVTDVTSASSAVTDAGGAFTFMADVDDSSIRITLTSQTLDTELSITGVSADVTAAEADITVDEAANAVLDTDVRFDDESSPVEAALPVESGEPNGSNEPICVDLCGDSTCHEMVCLGTGCACPETVSSCPSDCRAETLPVEPDDPDDPSEPICVDTCGDGECAEITCLGEGCPCAETRSSCPNDCGM